MLWFHGVFLVQTVYLKSCQILLSYPLPLHHHDAGQRSVAIDKENSVPERDARQGLHENVGTFALTGVSWN